MGRGGGRDGVNFGGRAPPLRRPGAATGAVSDAERRRPEYCFVLRDATAAAHDPLLARHGSYAMRPAQAPAPPEVSDAGDAAGLARLAPDDLRYIARVTVTVNE